MIHNQIVKNREINHLEENKKKNLENNSKSLKESTLNQFNTSFGNQKNGRMTISKRIMIMRLNKKNKRNQFRENLREEFLKLFDGYMLF